MRHFRPLYWVEVFSLQKLLNVVRKLRKPGIIIPFTKHIEYVVEHITNILDLHTRLQIVVFLFSFVVDFLLLLFFFLSLLYNSVKVLYFIVDIVVVGL